MRDFLTDHMLDRNNPRNWFKGQPILSDQISREGLEVVWNELEKVLQRKTPGHVVEFGCYVGTTSVFIRRLLDQYQQSFEREFHVYDSFEGLPQKGMHDSNAAGVDFEAGKLNVSKAEFLRSFQSSALQIPVIHKGWFNEILPVAVPQPIAFAFLDGDFYGSIIDSLRLVWPSMSEDGVILIDDYKRETLPGVESAVRDFFQGKLVQISTMANIAIVQRTH